MPAEPALPEGVKVFPYPADLEQVYIVYHAAADAGVTGDRRRIVNGELRQDTYSLFLPYDEMSVEDVKRFTRDDVEAALLMFNEDYVTFTGDDIAGLSGMFMPVNKRNWKKQKDHVQAMNFSS